MPAILITGNRPGAGKTSLAAALLVHLHEQDRRGAYWKPFAQSPETDPDVQFISNVLSYSYHVIQSSYQLIHLIILFLNINTDWKRLQSNRFF